MKQKKKGIKFENKVVQKTIASGKLWFDKGDIKYENYIIECKYTDKKGFRISLQMLEKIWNEALNVNKEPLLKIGIRKNEKEIYLLQCLLTKEVY